MSSNNPRPNRGLNLDEIEKHIREASALPSAGAAAPEDPLAELARIVSGGPVTRRDTRLDLSRNETRRREPSFAPEAAPPATPSDLTARRASSAPADPPASRLARSPDPDLSYQAEAPRSPRSQFSTIEDDINRLLQNSPPPVPAQPPRVDPPRRPDDLETAMRSLDNLLRAKQSPARDAKPPAFEEWMLRPSETELQPAEHAAPEPPSGHAVAIGHDAYMGDPPPEEGADAAWAAEPEPEPEFSAAESETPSRSRRPLFIVAAVLGVAAIGVGGALSMRGGHSERQAGGQPPIIVADKGPAKVVPENPGGLVIPDQNRQILERSPAEPPRPAKVVNSEEQPIDLKEAVRREAAAKSNASTPVAPLPPAPAIGTAPASASGSQAVAPAAPSFSDAAVAPAPDAQGGSLEPRRVRTVAIKPPEPGSPTIEPVEPLPQPKPAAPQAAVPPPQPSPTATLAPAPAVTASTPRPPPQTVVEAAEAPLPPKPKVQGSIGAAREAARQPQKPAARGNDDVTASTGAGPLQITPPQARAAPAGRPPQRVAAVEPSPPPATPIPTSENRPSGGGFVIQLSSEGSEASAQAVIRRLQSRFSELGPYASSVQKREVRGAMRYRVRFGAMSRETAGALCASLKSKGQDCILQPN
ncbi:MAG: hypothetical protein BGP06_07550 [Rhizobiales bacterium 65-9]|nr:SPOR domain-containing protein [Hyphomicrobiales bacterium]OJY35661.1 MAG: hypothetical protein BGP06_07550 [Rhizobiales bacterium 65-9]